MLFPTSDTTGYAEYDPSTPSSQTGSGGADTIQGAYLPDYRDCATAECTVVGDKVTVVMEQLCGDQN